MVRGASRAGLAGAEAGAVPGTAPGGAGDASGGAGDASGGAGDASGGAGEVPGDGARGSLVVVMTAWRMVRLGPVRAGRSGGAA